MIGVGVGGREVEEYNKKNRKTRRLKSWRRRTNVRRNKRRTEMR